MSQQPLSQQQLNQQRSAAALQTLAYPAVLVRGAVAAVFGIITVFWQDPSPLAASLAVGVYLVLSGAAVTFLRHRIARLVPLRALSGPAVSLAAAGLVVLALPGSTVLATVAAAGLAVGGLWELVLGLRGLSGQRLAPLARDWRLSGVLLVLTGVLLPFFAPLGSKALLGVLGGSAFILAVQLLLAGLSYQHDGRNPGGHKATAGGA